MALYKYTGTDERTFPSRSLIVHPGDEVEWEEAPGFDWESVDPTTPNPISAPEGGVTSIRADSEEVAVSEDAPADGITPTGNQE